MFLLKITNILKIHIQKCMYIPNNENKNVATMGLLYTHVNSLVILLCKC